jgi:hypothetical protein
MARMTCTICGNRNAKTGTGPGVDTSPYGDMCNLCYTEGGFENMHSDEGHDLPMVDTSDNGCWICHPDLNLAATGAPSKVGHTNTATKGPHRSHAACAHPRTPKDRAACRKAGGPKA